MSSGYHSPRSVRPARSTLPLDIGVWLAGTDISAGTHVDQQLFIIETRTRQISTEYSNLSAQQLYALKCSRK